MSAQNKLVLRAAVTLLLAAAFLGVAVSGVVLDLAPRGGPGFWRGWTLLGLDRHAWRVLHLWTAYLMLAAAAGHIAFNWKSLRRHPGRIARGIKRGDGDRGAETSAGRPAQSPA